MGRSSGGGSAAESLEVVEVGPKLAQQWLADNHDANRSVAWTRVDAFANDMRAGAWRLTHQGVAFDVDGALIDGQHRLHAVVRSGATVRLVVSRGIGVLGDPIDCGRPRSLALLSGRPTRLNGALNVLRMLEQGTGVIAPMTLYEANETYLHHADALEALPPANRAAARSLISGIMAGIAWALPVAREVVTRFAEQYVTGEMIQAGDPVFALRLWKDRQMAAREGWQNAMATLNAIRYAIDGERLRGVFTTASGYRAITGMRRARRVPNTPAASLVPREERGRDEE